MTIKYCLRTIELVCRMVIYFVGLIQIVTGLLL
uniref:Uncharacterized protein n=1 Tax=Siphoviridae sp. ct2D011 TaxID=2825314 RepID=A0A8S5V928_9CAUD|nr:MAG TPA: hypothetical protein [Siphoviridae sp. ct2D011]